MLEASSEQYNTLTINLIIPKVDNITAFQHLRFNNTAGVSLKAQSVSRRKNKSTSDVECLDSFDTDDDGFIDGDAVTGKVLSSFNFGMPVALNDNKAAAIKTTINETITTQNLTYTSAPRGLTPPINGEFYCKKVLFHEAFNCKIA